MSYKHLAGRLIETQRSMLGEPAIDIARSTDGITVTADGTVTGVEGDGRAVVDELARRYTDVLGDAAEMRLLAAAREFEDELALPASLGGYTDVDPTHRDPATRDPAGPGPSTHDPDVDSSDTDERTASSARDSEPVSPGPGTAESPESPGSGGERTPAVDAHGPDPDTGAVSDGGAVERQSSADGPTRVVSPTPSSPGETASSGSSGSGEVVSPTPSGSGEAASPTPSGSDEVVSPTPGNSDHPHEGPGSRDDGRVVETPEVSTTGETTTDTADPRDDGTSASPSDVDGEPTSYERAVDDDSEIELEAPVTVRYTVASDLGTIDDAGADLSSVYLLPDGEAGWQVPVTVEEAVASAVAEVIDCEPAAVGNATNPVEVDRLLATLRGERGDTASFELRGPLRGLTITFHHTGALAIH